MAKSHRNVKFHHRSEGRRGSISELSETPSESSSPTTGNGKVQLKGNEVCNYIDPIC